jgi:hypothetical protein
MGTSQSRSRESSRDSQNSTPRQSGRRLSKPRVDLSRPKSVASAMQPDLAEVLSWVRDSLHMAGLAGPIRVHELDEFDRACRHAAWAALKHKVVASGHDAAEPPAACLLLWGGLDLAAQDAGADEQSVGFDLERICADLRRGGVVAFSTALVDRELVQDWMDALGLDDCKILQDEHGLLLARGHVPWKPRERPMLRIGLALNDKKRSTFESRLKLKFEAEQVLLVEAEQGAPCDVVLYKGSQVPKLWANVPVLDSPKAVEVLDSRWRTHVKLQQCLVNHKHIQLPEAWLDEPQAYPVVAKPNDAREHLGLFLVRRSGVLEAKHTSKSGWFYQQCIAHDSGGRAEDAWAQAASH